MRNFQVAIDGPAGSGKSSISKIVSNKLRFNHLDTGAMYRAITLEAFNRKIDIYDESKFDFLDDINIDYNDGKMYLNGIDVSSEIRSSEVTNNVSVVSKHKLVRDKMASLQRKIASKGKVILDGRDIGYNVLPNADLKIFLTASIDERAKRRYLELIANNVEADLKTLRQEIIERDYEDSNRIHSPLKKAEDAIVLDTTSISMDEVCDIIINLINERMK